MNHLVPNNKFACNKKYGLQQEYRDKHNIVCVVWNVYIYQNTTTITAPHSEFQIYYTANFLPVRENSPVVMVGQMVPLV